MYYGVNEIKEIVLITEKICNIFPSANQAKKMVLGTIAVETDMGLTQDKTIYSSGVGLCQIDRIAFEDIKERTTKKNKAIIIKKLNINIDDVNYNDLALNPNLSILFCRLYYLLISAPIPVSIIEMAVYWKKYYNSFLGKGEVIDFIEKYAKYKIEDL